MIKPTRGYCLIEPDKAEEKTAAGLFVPETAQEKPQKGTVIDIGSGISMNSDDGELFSPEVKKDDKVYYKKWAGDEIVEGGKTLKFVKFEDILAVIE